METRVPQEVLQRTVRCRKALECLRTGQCGDAADCAVDYADGQDVLFLRSGRMNVECGYRIRFADTQVCMCPVHYALVHLGPDR